MAATLSQSKTIVQECINDLLSCDYKPVTAEPVECDVGLISIHDELMKTKNKNKNKKLKPHRMFSPSLHTK